MTVAVVVEDKITRRVSRPTASAAACLAPVVVMLSTRVKERSAVLKQRI